METYQDKIEEDDIMNGQLEVGAPIGLGHGTIDGSIPSTASAEEFKQPIMEHLVSVNESAPSSCIDGRPCSNCMDGSPTEPRPSVAGGGLVTAYAAAELVGWFDDADASPASKLNTLSNYLTDASSVTIAFGGHCDEASMANQFQQVDEQTGQFKPKTGCGANDRLPEILEQPYRHQDEVNALTEAVLNQQFSANKYDASKMTFVDDSEVQQHVADWNPTDLIDKLGADSKKNIEILQGVHHEVAVIFNYKKNTTIDRDTFTKDTGEQAFVVDIWYLDKLAKAMARGNDIVTQQAQLKHAMVAYQVSTYLTLCNGSQRPYFVG